MGNNDRIVVQEVIKGMAQTAQLEPNAQRRFKGPPPPLLRRRGVQSGSGVAAAVVVLREVDGLSREAQAGLRRTMEKYVGTCRLVLLANSTGRVIAPLRSRCFHLRVPAPSKEEVPLT